MAQSPGFKNEPFHTSGLELSVHVEQSTNMRKNMFEWGRQNNETMFLNINTCICF